MPHTVILTGHRDIQNWAVNHDGQPAISAIRNRMGETRPRLKLAFRKDRIGTPGPQIDNAMSPCSWKAWLAELDRQHLALRVTDGEEGGYEFVDRGQ